VKEQLTEIFQHYPYAAVFISLLVSILVAVLGLVPSFFITAANILFFGFWMGTFISFLGESMGAMIAFMLYRKGLRRNMTGGLDKFPRLKKLLNAGSNEAFGLILALRLIPFVPSGLITFTAAIGTVPATIFFFASSLGKIPALLFEAGSVYAVTRFNWLGKIATMSIALMFLVMVVKNILSGRKS
jgi:uncharacterized membrane protein YdjX (TVP38/TMEM64 family)